MNHSLAAAPSRCPVRPLVASMRISALCLAGVLAWNFLVPAAVAAAPTPESVLGHRPGEDYYLATYEESLGYFHKLAAASDRMIMVKAGTSSMGRPMEYAVISTPANLARWEEYKAISRRLADSRGLSDEQARRLAHDSRVIIHIDGGLHSDEAATHQMSMVLAHRLVSAQQDPQIDSILDNVILVLWPTLNPDGQTMIADWYRQNLHTPHETSPMPWLYQQYVGHDNNRDGYMQNMLESRVVSRAQQDYSPAVFYTQHQTSPVPLRIWVPPFGDPVSSNIHPLMRQWTNLIGHHMVYEFETRGLPGATAGGIDHMDNWYPGFLDYTQVFRHTASFFTETALHEYATPHQYDPAQFPEKLRDLKALIAYPSPWKGGWWRIGDAVKYMEVASMATLDVAARYRENLLYDRYQAGRDTIRRFATEGPRAYVIPAAQRDVPTAALLAQKLIDNGIELYTLPKAATLAGRKVPAGSWVVPMDQPFAGLVQELFETQSFPRALLDDKGAPEKLPYDVTGWTLPLQMGVEAVAVKEPLAQRDQLVAIKQAVPPAGGVSGAGSVYLLDQGENVSFKALNAALAAGAKAAFSRETGSIVLSGIGRDTMQAIAGRFSIRVRAVNQAPPGIAVAKARIGLYRPWKPSMDEGWTRWILEEYGYDPVSLYNADFRNGGLRSKADILIIPDMSFGWLMEGFDEPPKEDDLDRTGGAKVDPVPETYAGGIGSQGAQALRDFVAQGGTLVAFNGAAGAAAEVLGLPVANVLAGTSSDQFFCSGALLQVELADRTRPVTFGLPDKPVVMFESGPAFDVKPGFSGVVLARYAAEGSPLQSGVLLHPERIRSKIAALEVEYGKGRVYLYGFRPQWRGQTHGTYKFVFNTLYSGSG